MVRGAGVEEMCNGASEGGVGVCVCVCVCKRCIGAVMEEQSEAARRMSERTRKGEVAGRRTNNKGSR